MLKVFFVVFCWVFFDSYLYIKLRVAFEYKFNPHLTILHFKWVFFVA